jgi:hypothetical protein
MVSLCLTSDTNVIDTTNALMGLVEPTGNGMGGDIYGFVK